VRDLLRQHVGHTIRHRPHFLANLRLAAQPTGEPDIHVRALKNLRRIGDNEI
jgi:hypothetical protein